jgi:hypothetical protein
MDDVVKACAEKANELERKRLKEIFVKKDAEDKIAALARMKR